MPLFLELEPERIVEEFVDCFISAFKETVAKPFAFEVDLNARCFVR